MAQPKRKAADVSKQIPTSPVKHFKDTTMTGMEPLASTLPSTVSSTQLAHRAAFLRSKGIDPNSPLQFEIWPNDVRVIPNDYARSALFTIRNKREPRQAMQSAKVFHVEKAVVVTYTGTELRADDDELIWQQLLDYSKHFALGEPVQFNLHQLVRDLGWSVNARNYDRARQCITRLKANEVRVESERHGRGIGLSLIQNYEYEGGNESTGTRYTVWIHPNLMMLFAGKTYTRVAWKQYRELTPISRRLYDNLGSHKAPYPLALETFYKTCSSTCKTMGKWAQQVRAACDELVEAKMVKRAWVNDGNIYCER
jgi:hypothetical protein